MRAGLLIENFSLKEQITYGVFSGRHRCCRAISASVSCTSPAGISELEGGMGVADSAYSEMAEINLYDAKRDVFGQREVLVVILMQSSCESEQCQIGIVMNELQSRK